MLEDWRSKVKESEFRRITLANINRNGDSMLGEIVKLAEQAGATFEAEMRELPAMRLIAQASGTCLLVTGPNQDWRSLSIGELDEVLRRCKAVEEAVDFIRDASMDYCVDRQALLAILEGTK
jgi:hypothetical protein